MFINYANPEFTYDKTLLAHSFLSGKVLFATQLENYLGITPIFLPA